MLFFSFSTGTAASLWEDKGKMKDLPLCCYMKKVPV